MKDCPQPDDIALLADPSLGLAQTQGGGSGRAADQRRVWIFGYLEENPTGFGLQPRVARCAYLGKTVEKHTTPTGLCLDRGIGHNPVGVLVSL